MNSSRTYGGKYSARRALKLHSKAAGVKWRPDVRRGFSRRAVTSGRKPAIQPNVCFVDKTQTETDAVRAYARTEIGQVDQRCER